MIKGHGDDFGVQTPKTANFSTNIPLQCQNNGLLTHITEKITVVSHYPDPDASELAIKLAGKYLVNSQQVLVTNGATEAFYLLAEVFQAKHSLIFTPSFAEYEDACKRYYHDISFESNSNYNRINPADYHLIWLCNPNNPDGKLLDIALLKQWLAIAPDTVFVLDEAYIELTKDVPSMLSEVNSYPNLVIVRSMTKRYVIPGLRLGFMVANEAILEKIKPLLMPWRINQLAIEAGNYISDPSFADDFCETDLIKESLWLQNEIEHIKGFCVLPSSVNYFLVHANWPAKQLKMWLLKNYDILIRDASNFRGLDQNWFRIAVANRDSNLLLIKALQEWSRI